MRLTTEPSASWKKRSSGRGRRIASPLVNLTNSIFPVTDVRAIRINDLNVEKGICGSKQLKTCFIYHLTKIATYTKTITRIHKPCLSGNKATLQIICCNKK